MLEEIVELANIPYVKDIDSSTQSHNRLRSPQAIAEASNPEIGKALTESSSWTAQDKLMKWLQRVTKTHAIGNCKENQEWCAQNCNGQSRRGRVFAFAAFKSLGFSVPQFSPPLLSNAPENLVEQGTAGSKNSGKVTLGTG
ncbi:hypothetical protein D5086_013822 [Populus alba]|uniref:Uncharacterized protein n=1 Tax=Populus alba TaxID=43335 RepID=A0ACC4C7N5_POPAL